ncbi:MAG: alpha/beta fold hydrolase [Cyanobacteria bacterium J06639_14]
MLSLKKPAVPRPPEPAVNPLYSPRGAKLATRIWRNNTEPRAVCLMVPGGGWHSGYFEPLALFLNQKGFACTSYDPVCMGYSETEPGTPEGCMHINKFDDFVEDVFAALVWTKKQLQCLADVPIFLIGESFGGLQVLAAGLAEDRAKANGINLAGIIATGAGLKVNPAMLPPKPVIKVLAFLSRYFPRLKMPATDFSATFDAAFGDKEWARVARHDPGVQVSPRPTMGAATALVASGEKIARKAGEFGLPLLAIHAIEDCRTMCEAMQKFVDQSGPLTEGFWVEDTTGHQLLQDRDEVTSRVMEKMASWLLERT